MVTPLNLPLLFALYFCKGVCLSGLGFVALVSHAEIGGSNPTGDVVSDIAVENGTRLFFSGTEEEKTTRSDT